MTCDKNIQKILKLIFEKLKKRGVIFGSSLEVEWLEHDGDNGWLGLAQVVPARDTFISHILHPPYSIAPLLSLFHVSSLSFSVYFSYFTPTL
jgi:hypothetical protein